MNDDEKWRDKTFYLHRGHYIANLNNALFTREIHGNPSKLPYMCIVWSLQDGSHLMTHKPIQASLTSSVEAWVCKENSRQKKNIQQCLVYVYKTNLTMFSFKK